jgi:hypothetical protein
MEWDLDPLDASDAGPAAGSSAAGSSAAAIAAPPTPH